MSCFVGDGSNIYFLVKKYLYNDPPYKQVCFCVFCFFLSTGEITPVYEEEKQGMELFILGATKLK